MLASKKYREFRSAGGSHSKLDMRIAGVGKRIRDVEKNPRGFIAGGASAVAVGGALLLGTVIAAVAQAGPEVTIATGATGGILVPAGIVLLAIGVHRRKKARRWMALGRPSTMGLAWNRGATR